MIGYKARLDAFVDKHGGYWGAGHPSYPMQDWIQKICCRDTRRGYWEWAFAQADDKGDPDARLDPIYYDVNGEPEWQVALSLTSDVERNLDEGTVDFHCIANNREDTKERAEEARPGCFVWSVDRVPRKNTSSRPDLPDDVICNAAATCKLNSEDRCSPRCPHGKRHSNDLACGVECRPGVMGAVCERVVH